MRHSICEISICFQADTIYDFGQSVSFSVSEHCLLIYGISWLTDHNCLIFRKLKIIFPRIRVLACFLLHNNCKKRNFHADRNFHLPKQTKNKKPDHQVIETEITILMTDDKKLLRKGDAAPEFTAAGYDGRNIALSDIRKDGPVVLVFIRSFS